MNTSHSATTDTTPYNALGGAPAVRRLVDH